MTAFASHSGPASRLGALPLLAPPPSARIPAHRPRTPEAGDQPLPGERIAAAAIRDPRTGLVVEGACHGEAMARAGIRLEEITPELADWLAANEGFTTTAGRFVTREAAAAIARASGITAPAGLPPLTSEALSMA